MLLRILHGLVLFLLFAGLSSCKYSEAIKALSQPPPEPKLSSKYQYLRVSYVDRKSRKPRYAFFVLGRLEKSDCGSHQTWYGPYGQIIQTCEGRLMSTVGLPFNLEKSSFKPWPLWQDAQKNAPAFTRTFDVMPGYHYGLNQSLKLQQTTKPSCCFMEKAHEGLIWFKDMPTEADKYHQLPPSVYGVRFHNEQVDVIYSEQCITPQFCLALERWV